MCRLWKKKRKEKEGNLAIRDNMDGPWGHYAKWNKLDRKGQIPYDLTCGILKTKWNKTKENKTHRYREHIGGCLRQGVVGWYEMGESGQKIWTSSYKIYASWGCNVQPGD